MSSFNLRSKGFASIRRAALLCMVQFLCIASCQAQQLIAEIDEYMVTAIERTRFSGAILIAQNGNVLVSKTYGLASIENDVPLTPQTKFRIGSLTKQFTAMAMLILQERGALKLQDPICKYLPNCPDAWQAITIQHLLTHTSGITNFTYSLNTVETVSSTPPVLRNVERLSNKPLEFKPGRMFRYSNSGYVLLGHIIERVSGKTYEGFVRENIFNPLKMSNTGYDHAGLVLKRRATGYSRRSDTLVNAAYVDMIMPFSAGGLYSTIEDLYAWEQSLYTENLVSKASLDEMFTPFKGHYGYGWYIGTQFNRQYISHSGWIEGFATAIGRFPVDKLTVVVMSNLDSTPVNTMALNLASIALGVGHKPLESHRAIASDPTVYEHYVGEYEMAPNVVITVTKEENKLICRALGRPQVELIPEDKSKFFVKEYDAQITFAENNAGGVTHAVICLNGREVQAKKIK